jgi:hypothetical protein
VKPEGFLGPPTIKASASWGQFTFTGSSFSNGGRVWVGAYTPNGSGGWTVQGGTTVTATTTSCTKSFCILGGAVSGDFRLGSSGCQTYTVWAEDLTTGQWTSTVVTNQCG